MQAARRRRLDLNEKAREWERREQAAAAAASGRQRGEASRVEEGLLAERVPPRRAAPQVALVDYRPWRRTRRVLVLGPPAGTAQLAAPAIWITD